VKKSSNVMAGAVGLTLAAGAACAQPLHESFDDITQLAASGWAMQNNSQPVGVTGWFQGNAAVFAAQATAGYIGANFNNGAGLATISNWLLLPNRTLRNGDVLTFYTRYSGDQWPDRLQVRMSTAGASTNVGAAATSVGDFGSLLLDINPTYAPGGYPATWTQQVVTLSGLPAGGVSGRLAFRYFVENGGPNGANSDYIGIDEVDYAPALIDPSGGCCLADGTCLILTSANCTAQGGTYRGNGTTCAAPCPAPPGQYDYAGAPVSIPDGTGTNGCGTTVFAEINVPTSFTVSSISAGVYIPHTWQGDLQFRLVHGATTVPLVVRPGVGFNGSTYGFNTPNYGASAGSQMRLIDSGANRYQAPDIAAGVANVTGTWRPDSGTMAQFVGANASGIWRLEAEDCAGGDTGQIVAFRLNLGGGGGGSACYANCDSSTAVPFLNVLDFSCFLNKFASGHTYANCDNSTTAPVLNVLDFSCFLNKFAAGCSAP
jgi:subtilisin-like proprotein convertase family protein